MIGGTRFVGPRLVHALLARGHEVTTFNRGRTVDALPSEVERLHGDRSDPLQLARAVAGRWFDGCVDTIAMRGSDTTSAIDILDGKVGHYIHFSTGQVYLVRAACPLPAREEDYPGPLAPAPLPEAWDHDQWQYGIEKRECEDALEAALNERGFAATRLRLTMVHGNDDPRGRIRAYINRLQDRGPMLVPIEPGPPIRPIHASAVVDTVVRILEEGRGKGAAYNLSQLESWTHDELIYWIAGVLGKRIDIVRLPRDELIRAGVFPACAPLSHPWMSVLDCTKATEDLAFTPGGFDDWLPGLVEELVGLPVPEGFQQVRAREVALAS